MLPFGVLCSQKQSRDINHATKPMPYSNMTHNIMLQLKGDSFKSQVTPEKSITRGLLDAPKCQRAYSKKWFIG